MSDMGMSGYLNKDDMIADLNNENDNLHIMVQRQHAEIERLRHGIREISRFLDENRPGDASFVCAALLVDEQFPPEGSMTPEIDAWAEEQFAADGQLTPGKD